MDHNKIFPMGPGDAQYGLFGLPEQPNKKIEVMIRLQKNLSAPDMSALQKKLWQNNMSVVTGSNKEITVSGIPPEKTYGADTVLVEVRKYDTGATMIPPKK
ncbi:hypothetical protein M758_10G017600 [Ceratodon purpureus]|uniref:Uncharacterized protein n=1 Tax=Ceratodon purpureus TaxID=3225 RepID=A0A8T0GKR6_CERPU|nr:hypothetical protein KC19_10G018600 [Ceratodon purpureus]KAG0602489.1 hypothetical protein M758_10G017600 [Ceratodon purpureus]